MTDELAATDLTVAYGKVVALEGLSVTVRPGQVLCLLGANGAGKSSALNGIGGIVNCRSGRIAVDGRDISAQDASQRVSAGVAQVPEGRALFSSLTVHDNLILGAYRSSRRQRHRVLAQLEELFPVLRQRRDQPAGLLSGGEGQMLSIARALMSQPRYVLMDEPSLGLSPSAVTAVMGAIENLAQSGIGILLAEQAAHQALKIAHDVAVLERGRVVEYCPVDELAGRGALTESYLGGGAV